MNEWHWEEAGSIGPFGWYACDLPERRPDSMTLFHEGCLGCTVALRAAITIEPPPGAFGGWWRERSSLAAVVERWDALLDADASGAA